MALTVGARGEVYTQDKAERRDLQVSSESQALGAGLGWFGFGLVQGEVA